MITVVGGVIGAAGAIAGGNGGTVDGGGVGTLGGGGGGGGCVWAQAPLDTNTHRTAHVTTRFIVDPLKD
jgi:hypothetical protein